jgi:uncharacterized protein DUF4019
MMILLAFALAAAGPEDFSIPLPISPETLEGQRRIAERAAEICGRRFPQLGEYRFTGEETVPLSGPRTAAFEVRQELACLDRPPPATSGTPAPSDWRPTPEDEREVMAQTERYFALVDAGNAEAIDALWVESQRAAMPLPERAAALTAFRRQSGTPGHHRIVALTWYINPPNAPAPGIYVAADYERSYSALALNCGYVVWLREGSGRYRLVREETNILGREEPPMSPERLAETRSLMHCRGR